MPPLAPSVRTRALVAGSWALPSVLAPCLFCSIDCAAAATLNVSAARKRILRIGAPFKADQPRKVHADYRKIVLTPLFAEAVAAGLLGAVEGLVGGLEDLRGGAAP